MPTYQYACTACGEQHEAVQSFTDAPLTDCPACGGRLRKVFSAVGVVFKGSGFYKNDSRSAAGKGGQGSGDGAAAKTEGGAKGEGSGAAPAASGGSSSGGSSTGSGSSGGGASSGSGSSSAPAAKTA